MRGRKILARVMPEPSGFSRDYALGKELGAGNFGTVFEATAVTEGHHLSSEDNGGVGGEESREAPRCYAVKRIRKEGMDDRAKKEFRQEVGVPERGIELMKYVLHESGTCRRRNASEGDRLAEFRQICTMMQTNNTSSEFMCLRISDNVILPS